MRQALRRSMLFVLLLAGVAAPAAAQTGTITGRVTTSENSSAVANAEVHAISAGRTVAQSLTNTDGRYRLAVPAGTYDVHVEMVGYEAVIRPSIQVTAGGNTSLDIAISSAVFQLNPVIVTASKRTEKATEAPAHVEVVGEQQIQARPTVTPVDHLRSTPGVDVITQGVQSTNVSIRGFNNIFSGSIHTLTDHRLAGVPSLRVNLMHFIPASDADIQRMEVVLGPGAALYGPNTADGVLHIITRSPLVSHGTSLNLMTGNQDMLGGAFRTAHLIGDRVGFKLSGQLITATEFEYVDPDEVAERGRIGTTAADSAAFMAALVRDLGIDATEARRRLGNVGQRGSEIERWSGEARVDWRTTDRLTTTFQAGITNVGKGVELTGLGAGQVKDWKYSYAQTRANWGRFFAQAYVNASDAGETFLLRTGQPVVDDSKLYVGQLQHGFSLGRGRQDFTYGLDYFYTNPDTRGTINGVYEEEDESTEVGAYLQSETMLTSKLNLVLAGRLDDHSALPDPIFSPRAGLVFKIAENRALRLTFNRAFSTPSSLNQFLDLATAIPNQANDPLAAGAARLGYSVRVQGTGSTGFSLRQQDGTYLMRSPFTPAAVCVPAGSCGPRAIVPTNVAPYYTAAAFAVVQGAAAAGQPLPTPIRDYLLSLQPTAAQVGTNFIAGDQSVPISQLQLNPIEPIRESLSTSVELGYKGVIANRLSLAGDVWWTKREQLVTPLTVVTPLLALNGDQLGALVVPGLMQRGMTQAQAVDIVRRLASVPLGVISAPEVSATGAQMLATYTNVDDELDYWGIDAAVQYIIGAKWSVSGTASFVSDDHFVTDEIGVITLNAPTSKGSVSVEYRDPRRFTAELRARYNNEFPVQSGVYEGTACIEDDATAQPCVDTYTLFDLSASYNLPFAPRAALQFNIQNLLDEEYRSYPGAPIIGRMALLRLKYNF